MTRIDGVPEDKRGSQSPGHTATAPEPGLDDLLLGPVPLRDQPPSHMYCRNDLKPSKKYLSHLTQQPLPIPMFSRTNK